MASGIRLAVLGACLSTIALGAAKAASPWSFPVLKIDPPRASADVLPASSQVVTYTAPASAKGHYNLCLLLPQTADPVFIGYMYGAISEAKRLEQSLTIFNANSLETTVPMINQFQNCMTLGYNAILIQPALQDGWNNLIKQAQAKGIKVIEVDQGTTSKTVNGRTIDNFVDEGERLAQAAVADYKNAPGPVHVLLDAGPAGEGFVTQTVIGVKKGLQGTNLVLDNVVYGDMTANGELNTISDALEADPKINVIIANGDGAREAALLLKRKGLAGKIKVYSMWLDPEIKQDIENGLIQTAALENGVVMFRIGVDLAVEALDGNKTVQDITPMPGLATKANINNPDVALDNFAPAGWTPVFQTKWKG